MAANSVVPSALDRRYYLPEIWATIRQTNAMKFTLLPPGELSDEHRSLWRDAQSRDSCVASPFFSPAFADIVHAVRPQSIVCIIEDDSGQMSFFPFERWGSIGRPLAGPLSDFQGIIGSVENLEVVDLVRHCGLSVLDFDHMLAAQPYFTAYAADIVAAPYVDLTRGFASFEEDRKAAGSSVIAQTRRKHRKLRREIGETKFVVNDKNPNALRFLKNWKSQQYVRTGVYDVFRHAWTTNLLERILAVDQDEFAGILSTLYVDDDIVAVHMGMRSRTVWHYWFPAYNPLFERYSPGMILILQMIETAHSLGLTSIDLGAGQTKQKSRLTEKSVPVARGWVERPSLRSLRRRFFRSVKAIFDVPSIAAVLAYPRVASRPFRERKRFQ